MDAAGIGATSAKVLQTVGAKTAMVVASPIFGWVALAGVMGWQLWMARKGDQKINAAVATPAQ